MALPRNDASTANPLGLLYAISLYCGGGVAEALGTPGFRIVYAVDRDPNACRTYKSNNPGAVVRMADASDAATIRDAQETITQRIDVIFASPPCTNISSASGITRAERAASRTNLHYVQAVRWVRAFRPKFYVAENVPNVRNTVQFKMAVSRLQSLGYRLLTWTLDAADFGTPQHRVRTFLIAVREDVPLPVRPKPTHGEGEGLRPYVCAPDALKGLPEPDEDDVQQMSRKWQWLMRGIPPGKNWRWLSKTAHRISGNAKRLAYVNSCFPKLRGQLPKQAARRIPIAPCNALRTAPAIQQMMLAVHPGHAGGGKVRFRVGKKSGNVQVLNPETGAWEPIKTRLVSVPEYKRLFGAPDDWKLPVSDKLARYRILGNGICPAVFRAVCQALAEAANGKGRPPEGEGHILPFSSLALANTVNGKGGDEGGSADKGDDGKKGGDHSLAPLFSSRSEDWATPQHVFNALNEEFGFTLDAASSHENAKCAHHYTLSENGLEQDWLEEKVWLNPPYGRAIKDWMRKAVEASCRGATVVCLVPARTDTAWWHEWVLPHAAEVRLVAGRLRFGDGKGTATFPSAVVIYRPGLSGPPKFMAAEFQQPVISA